MKLGALLVREGVIKPDQLEEALKLQSIYGGRLGTNLIELGYVDVDTLAEWLSRQTGFPCATTAMLEEAASDLLSIVPAELAERYECFPLRKEGRKLHIAMTSPADLTSTDAISFKTGLRMVPHVVPEIQIQIYLERRYGQKRNERYIRLTEKSKQAVIPAGIKREKPKEEPKTLPPDARTEPPALAGPPSLAPMGPRSIAPPGPRSIVPPSAPSIPPSWPSPTPQGAGWTQPPPPSPLPGWSSPPSIPSGTMVWNNPATTPPPAQAAGPRVSTAEWLRANDTLRSGSMPMPPAAPPAPPVKPQISLADAKQALDAVTTRDLIGETLVQFAANRLDGALVLLVRENMAVGWKGAGTGIDKTLVDFVMLPLTVPSIFQDVVQQRRAIGGTFPDNALRQQFCTALRRPVPASVAIIPVILRNQVVNIIYADRLASADAMSAAEPLVEFAGMVSAAYERVLRESRKRA